jgi:hypothetical protein
LTFQEIVDHITELSKWLFMLEVLEKPPPGLRDDVDVAELVRDIDMELDTFVRSLTVGVLYRLLMLVYMSKGNFETPTFLDAYEEVSRRFPKPHWATEELLRDPALLADWLDYGLYLFHREGVFMHKFEGSWNVQAK